VRLWYAIHLTICGDSPRQRLSEQANGLFWSDHHRIISKNAAVFGDQLPERTQKKKSSSPPRHMLFQILRFFAHHVCSVRGNGMNADSRPSRRAGELGVSGRLMIMQ
jgi:hypothetical protein